MNESHPDRHRRQLYGRRKGPKLSAHQHHLIDTLLPKLALHLSQGADPKTYFSGVEDVWLEVGFGAGEHLLCQAQAHLDVGLIGAEPYISGVAKLLSKIDEATTANIRLHTDDARDVIDALPDASLGRVFILFPRSMAQDTPSQAPLGANGFSGSTCACDETGRGIAFRKR